MGHEMEHENEVNKKKQVVAAAVDVQLSLYRKNEHEDSIHF